MLEFKPHQISGIDFIVNKCIGRAILADDMGLGKSMQIIRSLYDMRCTQNLIVCPKSAKAVWKREILMWYPGAKESDILTVGEQPFEEREQLLKTKSLFTIINYAHIGTISERDKENKKIILSVDQRHVPTLKRVLWGSIVFDEAHKLRNRKSKAFLGAKAICSVNKGIPIIPVTGTPIYNRVTDLWPLLHLINPTKFSSFWKFVEQECIVTRESGYGIPVHNVIGPVRDPAGLKQRLSTVCIRREKRDVLDLPPITYQYVPLELSPEQRAAYEQMLSEMYTQWKGREVEATTVLAQLTRLKQMCVSPDLMPGHECITGVKIEWLADAVENLGDEKALVFSQFSTAIKRILPSLAKVGPVSHFDGGTPLQKRNFAVDNMQQNPKCKFLATTTQCGESYTCTAANNVFFLDLMWSPPANAQAVARVDRMGQTKPVTVYIPYCVNTVEEYIMQVLNEKQNLFDSVIPVQKAVMQFWQDTFCSQVKQDAKEESSINV